MSISSIPSSSCSTVSRSRTISSLPAATGPSPRPAARTSSLPRTLSHWLPDVIAPDEWDRLTERMKP